MPTTQSAVGGGDGGPAFPKPYDPYPNLQGARESSDASREGMTLRDWFAGQALTGLCACANFDPPQPGHFAICAYDMADAMLAERSKP